MSYEGSDDEWEVVDIVHTTSISLKPEVEPKPAKKEDVDALANQIKRQLSLKTTHDTQQMLLLEQKMKQQQRMSEQQLRAIQQQLEQITRYALKQQSNTKELKQDRENLIQQHRRQMIEQQEQIQSIQRNQMHTEQTIQQQNCQIAAAQKAALTAQQQNLALLTSAPPRAPSLQQPQQQQPPHSMAMQPSSSQNRNGHAHSQASNATSNAAQNGWLPSFPWSFGQPNSAHSGPSANGSKANHNVLDMDLSALPNPHNAEEKANILMEDDDDVLDWTNDYGSNNPLFDNPKLLKTHGIIGEGKYEPHESRQCGWVLKNKSSVILRLNTHLECLGGDKEEHGMRVKVEKSYEFAIKPDEEVYILVEVVAPSIPGKYCSFYQMVMDDGSKIGDMLEVLCEVKAKFNEKKEEKIAQVIKMGFDRKKVVFTLQKHKWKVQQTVNELIG